MEELCLKYCDRFVRQFADLYPDRRPLLLTPRNECGLRKFVCTTVRPTQLAYTELYNYDTCARAVADLIAYEPLELAGSLPSHLPSPHATIGWQAGDCFDMSTLLCSLLLGVGYDAYVVSGYAPLATTLADRSLTTTPSSADAAVDAVREEVKELKYAVPRRKKLESTFLAQREAARKTEARAAESNAVAEVDDLLETARQAEELDTMRGRRVHSWVLVLAGKRMLERTLFIEAATGEVVHVENSSYYAIESVWNASNYWVNMQRDVPVGSLNYDLSNANKWENLLYDQFAAFDEEAEEDDLEAEMRPQAEAPRAADPVVPAPASGPAQVLLDMPPTWVVRLGIERATFQARCPAGVKTTTYRKGRLDTFAEYSREDGMVERLTVYADAAMEEVAQVRERFSNRKDKLATREVDLAERREKEEFEPGRPKGLKAHVLVDGTRRELHFYAGARLDGLVSRVEHFGVKTIYTFDGSLPSYEEAGDGPLVRRSVSYAAGASGDEGDHQIRKMAECYMRNDENRAEEDVAKRTYDVANDVIKVRYHLGADRVTSSRRHYSKAGHTVVQVRRRDPFSRARDRPRSPRPLATWRDALVRGAGGPFRAPADGRGAVR